MESQADEVWRDEKISLSLGSLLSQPASWPARSLQPDSKWAWDSSCEARRYELAKDANAWESYTQF